MTLEDILPAVEKIRKNTPDHGSRAATYSRTYLQILELGRLQAESGLSTLYTLALVAYGWMPRILRLNPEYCDGAITALKQARDANEDNWQATSIADLAECLSSLVGASKVLHFTNPKVFPIWDARIERFRRSGKAGQYHMDQPRNYLNYVSEVHNITKQSGFDQFFRDFNGAYAYRLSNLSIPVYELSEVRTVEAAAFELAGSE
jgi:hypothetical protein